MSSLQEILNAKQNITTSRNKQSTKDGSSCGNLNLPYDPVQQQQDGTSLEKTILEWPNFDSVHLQSSGPNSKSNSSCVSRGGKTSKKDAVPSSISLSNFLKEFWHLNEKDKQKKISVYHYTLRKAKKKVKENGLTIESNFMAIMDEQRSDPKSMYYHGLNEQQRQYLKARRANELWSQGANMAVCENEQMAKFVMSNTSCLDSWIDTSILLDSSQSQFENDLESEYLNAYLNSGNLGIPFVESSSREAVAVSGGFNVQPPPGLTVTQPGLMQTGDKNGEVELESR